MGFFSAMLGRSGDRLDSLRKEVQRRSWAAALATATGIERPELTAGEAEEFEQLVTLAGDELARLNLFEGDALTNNGEQAGANEHYALALSQARTPELIATIRRKLQPAPDISGVSSIPRSDDLPVSCASGCCTTSLSEEPSVDDSFLTRDERLELIASGFPPAIADQYHQLSGGLLEAVLFAHEDRFAEAEASFSQVPVAARGAIFLFERSGLQARNGELAAAAQDLRDCLAIAADFQLALEGLVDLYLALQDDAQAEGLLHSSAGRQLSPAFVHARLARIAHARGAVDDVLTQAQLAFGAGSRDPELQLLVATIYEKRNELDAAEQHLLALGGAGCSGAASNIHLAEFRLRHLRDLSSALEGFKAAARHEPDNPYWWLRIGQTYLRLGWVREGKPLLAKVAAASSADERVRGMALEELGRL